MEQTRRLAENRVYAYPLDSEGYDILWVGGDVENVANEALQVPILS